MASKKPIIEYAELDLIRHLNKAFGHIAIAGFSRMCVDSSLTAVVSPADAQVYLLSPWSHTHRLIRKIINYTMASFHLTRLVRQFDAIYIFCPSPTAKLAALLAIRRGRPYALYVRGTWLNRHGNTSNSWRAIFARASFIIATGHAFQARLREFNTNVIVEVPLTQITPPKMLPRRQQRGRNDPLRLMYAGRVTEKKGIFDVVLALGLLRGGSVPPRYELLVAGGGTPEDIARLERTVRTQSLVDSVKIAKHLPPSELIDAFAHADIFVYPTYYPEGFPRVLYEAMMYGLPIVTCSMPGVDGYLVDSENCLFVRPANHADIARAISMLADSSSLRSALGASAYRLVCKTFGEFCHASHGEQVLAYLESVLR